jgi:hypothetical protein
MQHNRHGIPVLPHHPRVRVRQCFKIRHPDRASAFDHLVRFEAETGDMTCSVYRCRWCKYFHIGHPSEVRS